MLRDIECNTAKETEKIKKDNQSKSKKTLWEKRYIASQIALWCIGATIACSVWAGLSGASMSNAADYDKEMIYKEFMASEEFSDSYKIEFTKISNDYARGLITFDEYEQKIKYLNSCKYSQKVLENSNNTELKAQLKDIDQKQQDFLIVPQVALGASLACGIASASAAIASGVYSRKYKKENKNNELDDILTIY